MPITLAGGSQDDYYQYFSDENVAYGDLNGDGKEDAVVIISERADGTGSFYTLYAVTNQNNQPVSSGAAYIGDRAQISNLSIVNGVINITCSLWNSGNNTPTSARYHISGGKLVAL